MQRIEGSRNILVGGVSPKDAFPPHVYISGFSAVAPPISVWRYKPGDHSSTGPHTFWLPIPRRILDGYVSSIYL